MDEFEAKLRSFGPNHEPHRYVRYIAQEAQIEYA
jgi:hypothetical protein